MLSLHRIFVTLTLLFALVLVAHGKTSTPSQVADAAESAREQAELLMKKADALDDKVDEEQDNEGKTTPDKKKSTDESIRKNELEKDSHNAGKAPVEAVEGKPGKKSGKVSKSLDKRPSTKTFLKPALTSSDADKKKLYRVEYVHSPQGSSKNSTAETINFSYCDCMDFESDSCKCDGDAASVSDDPSSKKLSIPNCSCGNGGDSEDCSCGNVVPLIEGETATPSEVHGEEPVTIECDCMQDKDSLAGCNCDSGSEETSQVANVVVVESPECRCKPEENPCTCSSEGMETNPPLAPAIRILNPVDLSATVNAVNPPEISLPVEIETLENLLSAVESFESQDEDLPTNEPTIIRVAAGPRYTRETSSVESSGLLSSIGHAFGFN